MIIDRREKRREKKRTEGVRYREKIKIYREDVLEERNETGCLIRKNHLAHIRKEEKANLFLLSQSGIYYPKEITINSQHINNTSYIR